MPAYKNRENGSWYVVTQYTDWTGSRKPKCKRGFSTKREAQEWEQKFQQQSAGDLDMSFEAFCEIYTKDLKARLKESTWQTKENIIQKKLLPCFGKRKICEITTKDVIAWQNEMLAYRDKNHKPYSQTYLKTLHNQLSAVFNHAVRFYDLHANPAAKAGNMGNEERKEMLFWTKEEYLKFSEEMMDKPVSYYAFQMLYICARLDARYEVQFLLSVSSGCLFAATVLLFFAYSHQGKKERQTMQIQSELNRLQTEQSYYQILDQQNQELMIYAHDAKKHLAAIQALNEDPAIDSYVTKLSEQLRDYSKIRSGGNKLLDVMLHKYDIDCKMRDITFEYDVKVCNLSQLEDIDLVAILGNLLDNAVTASEQSTEKYISLTTVYRNRYSVIIVSNSCDTPPKQSGHHLISTKSGAGLHGFGMKSVAKSIKKYDGDYEWEYDEERHLFTVTVMVSAAS